MGKLKNIALSLALISSMTVFAQDCDIQIAPVVDDASGVPAESKSLMESVLTRLATENGATKDITFADFIISVKVDVLDKHILPGPPRQYVNQLGVTFYVTNVYDKTKYATQYFEVNGVGQSETKSYNDALKSLRPQNTKMQSFMATAKQKILAYYDKQYPTILAEAQRKAGLKMYDEALAMVCAIPTCSKGGKEAITTGLKIYGQYRDRYAAILLDQAQKIWAANPTMEGGQQAVAVLMKVDPEASNKKEVTELLTTINKQTRIDIDFWTKERYKDAVALEEARIDAIKEIGKAYGSRQSNIIVGGMGAPVVVGGGNGTTNVK